MCNIHSDQELDIPFLGMGLNFQLVLCRMTFTPLHMCGYSVLDYYMSVLKSRWCTATPAICSCNLAAVVPTLWMWWGGDTKCRSGMPGKTDPYWSWKFTAKITRITSVWFGTYENNSSYSSQIHHFWSGIKVCDWLHCTCALMKMLFEHQKILNITEPSEIGKRKINILL